MSVAIFFLLFVCSNAFVSKSLSNRKASTVSNLAMGPSLYGSQGSRSPLVNWYLIEQNIDYTMMPARPSNHPFGQIPFLTDEGGVEVFESGAILLYLADKYGGHADAAARAKYTSWVVWSNSELDAQCFGKGQFVTGTQIDKQSRQFDKLEEILGGCEWLVDNEFSVADVAVGSYLNYIPIFFGNSKPGNSRPNILKYMKKCAERPSFSSAFGPGHSDKVKDYVKANLKESDSGGGLGGFFKR